ncbi:elongation factor G [Desulfoplanes formicivorans]|uniref:Elongation factor G n=1 Tax=Desulfoplanes formicivorans TaxID=1592317 RepID=A0A194AFK7_9BACT|nr:elongation factor G [Desulfoplanes formicivorans]GAU07871.1 elongation factor G [Desulfoplanes formicivorans]
MASHDAYLEKLRNIGIIAHIDAGKTTLTERILFYTGRIHRMGEVHDGSATMDFMPEEQERGITIASACTSCRWDNHQINIIDTPGHVDFTIEVDRCLRVLDGAVGVFCGVGGVEPQSETVWRQSAKYNIPKLAFVNKMDRAGADFAAVLESMRTKLDVVPLPVQIPVGEGGDFRAVIDVLSMRMIVFDQDTQGAEYTLLPLDQAGEEVALPWRERALEILAEQDDAIMEAYLGGDDIPVEVLHQAVRKGTLAMDFVPVFAGSALKNIGVQPFLDGVNRYLPSPLDVHPAQGIDPTTKHAKAFRPSSKEPLSALAFKVSMASGRKMVLLRIYSGTIEAGQTVYNITQDVDERVARLFVLHADHREKLSQARAGQIVAAAGLKHTRTADTLCSRNDPLILEKISAYKPVISLALEPKNASEEEKLIQALDKILQEDPTLIADRDKDTDQIILSGMGELHLDVVQERLRREFKVGMRAGNPQVVFQETVRGTGQAEAVFEKELGDTWHYGHVRLAVESRERGTGNRIVSEVDEATCSAAFLDAAVKGVEDGLQSGVLKGYPVQDVRVRIMEIPNTDKRCTDVGFRMAAVSALKQALTKADPLLLEPIMAVEIGVPEEFVGECISLLGTKGARIENMFDRGGQKTVRALAPLRKMFGFSTALRSATQGRAGLSMSFDRFDVLD